MSRRGWRKLAGATVTALILGGAVRPAAGTGAHPIALRRGPIEVRSARAPGIMPAPSAPRRLQLVQFGAPPTDADLTALTAAGAQVVQYVPQNAYLVWTEAGKPLETVRQRAARAPSSLSYFGNYRPNDAIAPALDHHLGSDDVVAVTVQLYAGAETAAQDLAAVEALADKVVAAPRRVLRGRYTNVRLQVSGRRLEAIAQVPSVINVEPFVEPKLFCERQGQILAGNLDTALQHPTGPGYLAWLSGLGFSTTAADYPIVAVVDDGVDNGTGTPANSEFYELNSSANPSRLAFAVLPPGSSASSAVGPDGHGNINASIVGGYNAGTGAAVEDAFGFNYGVGISPFGRLANVRIFAPSFDNGFGNAAMVGDYFNRGARVSANSWGADVLGAYDAFAQEYDALTRDAQDAVAGNQELLFVFAAGNAGPSDGTVGSPGTAKNVLTVGASETSNPDSAAGDGCGFTTAQGNDARDLASFSSRGPCADGRTKPEIVAPGTFIQGAAAQPTFNGSGVCGAAGNNFAAPGSDALFPAGSAYTWSSGTSHSTPAIAGYVSLVREFLARTYGLGDPSPALEKAFVLHSGRHLTGTGANENLPGKNQGFGLANMGTGFDTAAPRLLYDQEIALGNAGQSLTFSGHVDNPALPVRVTLVWTDAPGATIGAAYVNDLNLSVDVLGSTYLGNNFLLGVSQPGGSADARNNSESVFLPAGTTGPMTVTVQAATIAGDGVPGNADLTDQDFALVAYNFVASNSSVVFERERYGCTDTASIRITDGDLAGTGALTVPVTASGGDAETASLNETAPSSGAFVGSLPIAAAPGSPGDGTLQVANGDSIAATYNDADDGSGNPAIVQAGAAIDCLPALVSAVSANTILSTDATITFSTDESTTALVRYGTSCGSLTQSQSASANGTAHAVTLSGLTPQTQYFFAVEATDEAGNVATDDNGGSCYSLTTTAVTDPFTELFASDNDLLRHKLTFTPDGSPDFYSACATTATSFPTSPTGGTTLVLGDDDYAAVSLTGGAQVSLYGANYDTFYVGSNGYITFDSGDAAYAESLAAHFSRPRIAALFDDLNPNAGGTVSWKQLSDRVAVTFQSIHEYNAASTNSIQIEMFFNGKIRITYVALAARDGLAGLSRGRGTPGDFIESDLTAASSCGPPLLDTVVLALRPLNITLTSGAAAVSRTARVTVRNASSTLQTLVLNAADNDCPAGTIIASPDFGGSGPSVSVNAGSSKTATVPLSITSAGFDSINKKAVHRCTLLFNVGTLPAGTDATPKNNSAGLELSVIDGNDPQQPMVHEALVRAAMPLFVSVAQGQTAVVRKPRITAANADASGSLDELITVSASDGDCPPGTIGVLDFNPLTPAAENSATIKSGLSKGGPLPVTINAANFTSTSSAAPARCTALISATAAGGDSDGSNDTTKLVIDVIDRNDLVP
ncbi:MAG: S8 family serine peptidase [Deltaproteobacteria bacterium]|nr:S8 family serine peptidase [Deltaproteobacteria bacterium]